MDCINWKLNYILKIALICIFVTVSSGETRVCSRVSNTVTSLSSFSSVTQSCPTVCDPMNRSKPGLPVHQQLLEFTQTHAHWVSDAIQCFILQDTLLVHTMYGSPKGEIIQKKKLRNCVENYSVIIRNVMHTHSIS